jgi:predicted nuclease of predicted toxin-antitoxin system
MKLLFDQNISFRIVNKLIDSFPDCKHVSHVGLMNSDDTDYGCLHKSELRYCYL